MPRVLVVEDDEALAESLRLALEDDYDVVVAHHGRDALDKLALTPVDVVVLDLMMPVMDGETFLEEARQRGSAIPVIVASAGPDLRRRVREMGADAFVQKPFNLDDLLAKLAAVTGGPGGARGGSGPGDGSDPREPDPRQGDGGGAVARPGNVRWTSVLARVTVATCSGGMSAATRRAVTITPSSCTTARTICATLWSSCSPPGLAPASR